MRIPNLLLAFLFAIPVARNEADAVPAGTFSCKDITSNSAHLRLKQYLFCDYDQDVRPNENHRNATSVIFRLIIQSINVNTANNVIDLHSWSWFAWVDQHLKWDPSKYDNIKWIHVPSYLLWLPDITVHSASDMESSVAMPPTNCWLYNEGNIYCVPATVYSAHCIADHKWWPFDTMNCTFEFGSWSYSHDEVEFRVVNFEMGGLLKTKDYQQNLEFDVAPVKTSEHVRTSKFGGDFTTKLVSYHIFLRRHTSLYSAAYLLPAVVLMIMTLTILWLEPKSIERMAIGNVSFILHLLCMHHLYWIVPPNGSDPPKLLLLYEASLVLTTLSIILTSILRHVQELNVEAPLWISSSTASILRSKMGRILLVSVLDPTALARIEVDADDNTDLVSFDKKASSWEYVVIVVGWFAFFAVSIAYTILMAVYFPTSSSGDYALNT